MKQALLVIGWLLASRIVNEYEHLVGESSACVANVKLDIEIENGIPMKSF